MAYFYHISSSIRLMQIKLKAVDPLVIEDYSTELQFQGKQVILLPVLEEDNMHFVFKWFLYCICVIDLDRLKSNGSVKQYKLYIK